MCVLIAVWVSLWPDGLCCSPECRLAVCVGDEHVPPTIDRGSPEGLLAQRLHLDVGDDRADNRFEVDRGDSRACGPAPFDKKEAASFAPETDPTPDRTLRVWKRPHDVAHYQGIPR